MGASLHFNGCFFASWWMLFRFASSADLFRSRNSNKFLPHIEWVTFCRREFYIPYENQLHSLRECTSFFTRIHFILVRNVVDSRIEHKILSAGNNYFLGLKICILGREMLQSASETKSKLYPWGFSLYWTTSS